jgi:hypothetical protein
VQRRGIEETGRESTNIWTQVTKNNRSPYLPILSYLKDGILQLGSAQAQLAKRLGLAQASSSSFLMREYASTAITWQAGDTEESEAKECPEDSLPAIA